MLRTEKLYLQIQLKLSPSPRSHRVFLARSQPSPTAMNMPEEKQEGKLKDHPSPHDSHSSLLSPRPTATLEGKLKDYPSPHATLAPGPLGNTNKLKVRVCGGRGEGGGEREGVVEMIGETQQQNVEGESPSSGWDSSTKASAMTSAKWPKAETSQGSGDFTGRKICAHTQIRKLS